MKGITGTAGRHIVLFVACQMLLAFPISVAAQGNGVPADHASRIRSLSEQLRWHNEEELKQYDATKAAVTQNLLHEIDRYIAENFSSDSTADQVKSGLDSVLGRKDGELIHNVAFLADLPSGHFLIVGIELWRGGSAIGEDAVSFRAYQASGKKLFYTASIGDMTDLGVIDLNATRVPAPPSVPGEFWFISWADVPPLAPYTVAIRLYAFDGKAFREVWAPENFIAHNVDSAVDVSSNGSFVVHRMPDWKSQVILNEQYSVIGQEPQKTAEWTSDRP